MQPITAETMALFESQQRQVLRITGIDINGRAISITETDVISGSFHIDRYVCTTNQLEIGTAVASELTMMLNNYDEKFNDIIFEGTEMYVEIGIADWESADPTITWLPCGYFTSYVQPRALTVITINALDRMMRFDQYVPKEAALLIDNINNYIVDASGNNIEIVSTLTLPCTMEELIAQLCMYCQVPMSQDISGFTNVDFTLNALPVTDTPYTFRNLLQWCAQLMCANAYIDYNGELVFGELVKETNVPYRYYYDEGIIKIDWTNNGTRYACTPNNRYSSDIYENVITVTGVKFTIIGISGGENLMWGTDSGCVIDLTKNKLLSTDVGAFEDVVILPTNVDVTMNGFKYKPFSASVNPAPYVWPLDRVTLVGKEINKLKSGISTMLTNVNFMINGCTKLQSVGETEQTARYARI